MMLLVSEFMLLKNKIVFHQHKYRDRTFIDHCIELDQFSTKMQHNILKLRLSPVKPVFNSMRRVARTTAQQVKKKVELEIHGDETLVDRTILDVLADPLMHLVRNSIDHGIEDVETRKKHNKPVEGIVGLKAGYASGEVVIQITDDGGGIDATRIKSIAVSKGLIDSEQAASMTNQEAYQIIFMPGFSGAEKVTETSGRGVGMDVVKNSVESVGGRVEVMTEMSIGTTISIKLPLSLAIVDCLGFEISGQSYAIPQMNIEEVLSIESVAVKENLKVLENGSHALILREAVIPIVNLPKVFGRSGECTALILVRYAKQRFILEVGSIIGPLSIVSQSLPPTFAEDAPFSGVTKQGDGSLLFQIDLSKIAEMVKSNISERKKRSDHNRGAAGTDQEATLMNSSEIRRMQQKTIFFQSGLHFCIPVQRAKRIVFIRDEEIKEIGDGGKSYITLDGQTVALIWIEELILRQHRMRQRSYSILLFNHNGSSYGIPMNRFIGIERMPDTYDTDIAERGVLGSTVINGETTLALDLPAVVSKYKGEVVEVAAPEDADVKKPRVLCAEDDKFFMSELTASLVGAGYEPVLCEDGLIAKKRLSDPDFVKTIDFVITDIEMPNMTGLALCRWIKSNPDTRHLPIVAYTAITTREMRQKMIDAGAKAFISKMSLDTLIDTVDDILHGKSRDVSAGEVSNTSTAERIVTFKISETWYGLPMESIKEVSPISPSAEIPDTDVWMGELTSFRGIMIPVLDLYRFFFRNINSADKKSIEQAVVESKGSNPFALRVGKIGEVVLLSDMTAGNGLSAINESEKAITDYVSGVYTYKDRVIFLLCPRSLSCLCERTEVRSLDMDKLVS